MHHFIYPSQDTFVTDTLGFEDLNFGIDETLRVGTQNITSKITYPTTVYPLPANYSVINFCVDNFSGSLGTASFYGSASNSLGHIFNTSVEPVEFTVDWFSGSFIGSAIGWEMGTPVSASNATGSFTSFSGSIIVHSLVTGSTWEGLFLQYNDWQSTWESVLSGSGVIDGWISGSIVTPFLGIFNGWVTGFTGKILIGTLNGWTVVDAWHTDVVIYPYKNRALVQFDISTISQSIASGDIVNPEFRLKLNVAREFEIPIKYQVYAFPISESWEMGDGYISDNGSPEGASWIWRDRQGGVPWAVTGSSYLTSPSVTQAFDYQVGDINMNVTPIVNAWISGTIPNNGIVLISSDEFSPTGSGMGLYFFSKDTNTIYEPVLDVGWKDSSEIWTTGSVTTASVTMASIPPGLLGVITDSASMSGSLYGGFTGYATAKYGDSGSAWGSMTATGLNGNIISMSIYGHYSGSITQSYVTASSKCGACTPVFNAGFNYPGGGQVQSQYQYHDIYGWGHAFNTFNQYNWYSMGPTQQEFGPGFFGPCGVANGTYYLTMSFLNGTLIDGNFSGSTFTSSFNGYQLGYGYLFGVWNESMLLGTQLSASFPFTQSFPSEMYVTFKGLYLNGLAFGEITNLSASSGYPDYGIFDGVFINGLFAGSQIHAPFTGSILTSSYYYTGSVTFTSSSLSPVVFGKPFTTVIQNIPSTVKAGDIVKINVFARPEFPLKNFNRQTQFTQFLIPQYLPTSSYYSIKDNETEQIILGFDNYTQLSCDPNGNFFMLDTTGYPQERYFRLLIRTEQDGAIYTFDKGNIFKIVR